MKRIKSFVFYPESGKSIEEVDLMVNNHIAELTGRGIDAIDLKISASNNAVVFTIIWEETVR